MQWMLRANSRAKPIAATADKFLIDFCHETVVLEVNSENVLYVQPHQKLLGRSAELLLKGSNKVAGSAVAYFQSHFIHIVRARGQKLPRHLHFIVKQKTEHRIAIYLLKPFLQFVQR